MKTFALVVAASIAAAMASSEPVLAREEGTHLRRLEGTPPPQNPNEAQRQQQNPNEAQRQQQNPNNNREWGYGGYPYVYGGYGYGGYPYGYGGYGYGGYGYGGYPYGYGY